MADKTLRKLQRAFIVEGKKVSLFECVARWHNLRYVCTHVCMWVKVFVLYYVFIFFFIFSPFSEKISRGHSKETIVKTEEWKEQKKKLFRTIMICKVGIFRDAKYEWVLYGLCIFLTGRNIAYQVDYFISGIFKIFFPWPNKIWKSHV